MQNTNTKRYQFNKLVRNKLPPRMIREGIFVNKTELSEGEYLAQLKNKIVEEAKEVASTNDKKDLLAELGDVLEVIYEISKASNFDIKDIEKTRLEKREINGFFDSNSYINYIEVDQDNHKLIEYLNNKNRPYKFVKSDLE